MFNSVEAGPPLLLWLPEIVLRFRPFRRNGLRMDLDFNFLGVFLSILATRTGPKATDATKLRAFFRLECVVGVVAEVLDVMDGGFLRGAGAGLEGDPLNSSSLASVLSWQVCLSSSSRATATAKSPGMIQSASKVDGCL